MSMHCMQTNEKTPGIIVELKIKYFLLQLRYVNLHIISSTVNILVYCWNPHVQVYSQLRSVKLKSFIVSSKDVPFDVILYFEGFFD